MFHYALKQDRHSSHQQIAAIVRKINRGPVLDVGAAQGMLGQLLAGSGLDIDAVEPNPRWAEAARGNYRNALVGTIEQVALPEKTYRVVVCGDVLEHTADPVAVLRQLKEVATDDATFVISLPNVAHFSVRLMLMLGMFPKMERGPLDRTHLHFFTRKTATQMLSSAGLDVTKISATPVPLEQIWPRERPNVAYRFVARVQWGLVRLLPKLFGFQWIFVASRRA